MEVTANKQRGVSTFYRHERQTPRGVHVGFVCDSETPYSAKISTYVWGRISRGIEPKKLINEIFCGVI